MTTIRRAKIIVVTLAEAKGMSDRIRKMGRPTLNEMTDPTKTVFDLVWLRDCGQNYRIER